MKKGHFPFRLCIGLGLSAAVCLFILGTFYFLWSLKFDLKDVGKIPERSLVYDMDGKVYSRLFGENRILADEGSPLFEKALLAREDSRFFHPPGIDPVAIILPLIRDLSQSRT